MLLREGIARLLARGRLRRRRAGRRRRRPAAQGARPPARRRRRRRADAAAARGRRAARRARAAPAASRASACSCSRSSTRSTTRSTSSATRPEGVGYLLKERVGDVDAFVDAVERVAAGGSALDPEVVGRMLGRRARDGPLDELSPRERDVLAAMAEGKSNHGIAEALVVTEAAVEKHVTRIFHKLGLGPDDHRAPPRARRADLPAARPSLSHRSRAWIRPRTPVPTWEGSRMPSPSGSTPIGPTRASCVARPAATPRSGRRAASCAGWPTSSAALRRVAEIAARGAEPDAVFAPSRARRRHPAEAITLVRFDGESELVVVAVSGGPAPLGRRIGFEAETLPDRVRRRAEPCAWTTTPSSAMPGWRSSYGLAAAVAGAPIAVDGRASGACSPRRRRRRRCRPGPRPAPAVRRAHRRGDRRRAGPRGSCAAWRTSRPRCGAWPSSWPEGRRRTRSWTWSSARPRG